MIVVLGPVLRPLLWSRAGTPTILKKLNLKPQVRLTLKRSGTVRTDALEDTAEEARFPISR